MNAEPSRSNLESAAAAGGPADTAESGLPGARTPARATPARRLWLATLGAGLVSGLIAWVGGEAIYPAFHVQDEIVYPANYKTLGGYQKQGVDSNIRGAAQRVVERKKAAASFGLLGLVLAAGLGLSGGWASGSPRRAALAAAGGGLVGVLAGAGLSWAVVTVFFRYVDPESGFTVLSLTHAAIFIGIGAAAGLGLGLGLGDGPSTVRALFGGLAGGSIGTIALETVNALAFPMMPALEPIATERIARLVMYLCVAIATGLIAGLIAPGRARIPTK